jgi:hypothetical protein
MNNIFSLLPLALDAGSPQEVKRVVVRKPYYEPAPIPEAWLAPSESPSRLRGARGLLGVLLAIVLVTGVVDYFTPPDSYVTPTSQDGACPAPEQAP